LEDDYISQKGTCKRLSRGVKNDKARSPKGTAKKPRARVSAEIGLPNDAREILNNYLDNLP